MPTEPPPPPPHCLGLEDEPTGLSEVARRRREEIMDAAEAIIAGAGIDKLSLSQIEERAGMSRGQLTYYFKTREAILLAVYQRMLRRMIQEFLAEEGPKPMTGRAWDCFRHAVTEHLKPARLERVATLYSLLFTLLAQMGHRPDYRSRLAEIYDGWRTHIQTDLEQSVAPPYPFDTRVAASLIQAVIQGLEIQLMIDPQAFDRTAMAEACTRLFAPLFKRAGITTEDRSL